MSALSENARKELCEAFRNQNLSLYLGAGVSAGSQLPTWEKLVVSMYFAIIAEQKMEGWRPFPNYLFAISEWYLGKLREPLEVTARKTRGLYRDDAKGEKQFRAAVQQALYGVDPTNEALSIPQTDANRTLSAVAELCDRKRKDRFGVRSVITYNYDNLLELALEDRRPADPVYSADRQEEESLPVFHVHGFIPYPYKVETAPSDIVFTEEEYNRVAIDPYSWSNIVQLREMSDSVGLMVGLSLADRNIRRLLDALRHSPVRPNIFALMQKPKPVDVSDEDTEVIHSKAKKMVRDFEDAGIKFEGYYASDSVGAKRRNRRSPGLKRAVFELSGGNPRPAAKKAPTRYAHEIRKIIAHVDRLEQRFQTEVLNSLGVDPIWYDSHDEIPGILAEIT